MKHKLQFEELVIVLSLIHASTMHHVNDASVKAISLNSCVYIFRWLRHVSSNQPIIGREIQQLFADIEENYRLVDSEIYRREGDKFFLMNESREYEITSEFYNSCSPQKQSLIDLVMRSFINTKNQTD
jgi:hypothetical protein